MISFIKQRLSFTSQRDTPVVFQSTPRSRDLGQYQRSLISLVGISAITHQLSNLSIGANSLSAASVVSTVSEQLLEETDAKGKWNTLKIHSLAVLRLGVVVSSAKSIMELYQKRDRTNPHFLFVGAAIYGSAFVSYAIKSHQIFRHIHDSHASNAVARAQASYAIDSVNSYLEEPIDCHIGECGLIDVSELIKITDYLIERERHLSCQREADTFFFTEAPLILKHIETLCPQASKEELAGRLSFRVYLIALSITPKFWQCTYRDYRELERAIDSYDRNKDIKGSLYLDLTQRLNQAGQESRNRAKVSLRNYYHRLYSKFRSGFDAEQMQKYPQQVKIYQKVFCTLFSGMNEDDLKSMDEFFKKSRFRSSRKLAASILEISKELETKKPSCFKKERPSSPYLEFPGMRLDVAYNGGQSTYQFDVVKERLVSFFEKELSNLAWTEPFNDDPANLVSMLLLGRSNEEPISLKTTESVIKYKESVDESLREVFLTHNIADQKQLIHYVSMQWARLNALYAVLGKGLSIDHEILAQCKWNYLAVFDFLFKDHTPAEVLSGVRDDDYEKYLGTLKVHLNSISERENLSHLPDWIQFLRETGNLDEVEQAFKG